MPLCISTYQPPAMSSLMSFMMPTDFADIYPDCFLYLHLDVPPKGSEGFSDWMMLQVKKVPANGWSTLMVPTGWKNAKELLLSVPKSSSRTEKNCNLTEP